MDTYPCPACGGVASESEGCRSCGRAHDPVAARLAHLNQTLVGLADESRQLAATGSELRDRQARLQAQRSALTAALARQLAQEQSGERVGERVGERGGEPSPEQGQQRDEAKRETGTTTPPRQRQPRVDPTRITAADAAAGAETSPRSAQNTLLTLGGVMLAIAAVVFAGVFYSSTQPAGRAFILAVSTTLALAIPVMLSRRRLTATAETIAGLGLLLVLLDGYVAYRTNLAGLGALSAPLFAAVLFAMVAAVALAYRLATHLRAPQFAGLLAIQPLLPLLAVHLGAGRDALAATFTAVAAQNLAAVVLLRREPVRRPRPPRDAAGLHLSWPRMLRELAWMLFGLALATSAGLLTASLAAADTTTEAVRALLIVVLAAAVGIAAGHLSGRDVLRHVAIGAAIVAVIAAVSRVNAIARPDFTLVLTAAVATCVALISTALPPESRRGAQIGSLVGAALVVVGVVWNALGTTVATVRAATTPGVWEADLAAYASRVHTVAGQVPVAAGLLAVLAVAAAPPTWRTTAAVSGAALTVLTLPGTGAVAWWLVPLLAVVAMAAATVAALFAATAGNALAQATTAGLLGLYAVATSLARPELTALTCVLVASVGLTATVAQASRPAWFGQFADRVADATGGAAACTAPVAVATLAYLAGAPAFVLVPLTLLTTAAGVLGAALLQVGSASPRTGSAGGALAAAAGCALLGIMVGASAADYLVAALLMAAAIATVAARAFELSAFPLLAGVRAVPAAVSTLVDSVDGTIDRPEAAPPSTRRFPWLANVDGATTGAALATAALIIALARLAAVAVPGIGLVTTAAMVLTVSIGVLLLPEAGRRGPRLGGVAVGGAVAVAVAAIAVIEAGRTLTAGFPFWAADLAAWTGRVSAWAPYGWQVPASLLLAAVAAWALLPRPTGGDIGFVTVALAGLAAPAALGLPLVEPHGDHWWPRPARRSRRGDAAPRCTGRGRPPPARAGRRPRPLRHGGVGTASRRHGTDPQHDPGRRRAGRRDRSRTDDVRRRARGGHGGGAHRRPGSGGDPRDRHRGGGGGRARCRARARGVRGARADGPARRRHPVGPGARPRGGRGRAQRRPGRADGRPDRPDLGGRRRRGRGGGRGDAADRPPRAADARRWR